MINSNQIEDVKYRLIKEFNPKKIYIFGSYAWGQPNEDSDLDIMIIIDKIEDRIKTMRNGIKALRGLKISKDLIVETEEEFKNYSRKNYRIENEILKKGVLIYESREKERPWSDDVYKMDSIKIIEFIEEKLK